MSALRRLGVDAAGQGFSYFLGNASYTLINAVASIVIARLLGPSQYGLYSLSLVLPLMLVSLLSLGIDYAVVRSASMDTETKKLSYVSKFRHALIFKLLIGILSSLLIFILADSLSIALFNRPEISPYLRIGSIIALIGPTYSLVQFTLIGVGAAGKSGGILTTQSIVKLLVSAYLILAGFSIAGAVAGVVVGYLVGGLIGLAILQHTLRKSRQDDGDPTPLLIDIKSMIMFGLPIYLSGLLIGLMMQYNYIVLAWNFGDTEIGGYGAALNGAAAIMILATPITMILFPVFSKISGSMQKIKQAVAPAIKYTVLVLAPASMFVSLFSRELITVVYGPSYSHASIYLSIYSTLFLFYPYAYMIPWSLFNGLAMTRQTLYMGLAYTLTILPVSPLLARTIGVEGVVSSFLIGYAAAGIYGIRYAQCRLGLEFRLRNLVRIYLSSFLAISVTYLIQFFLNLTPILKLVLSASIFLLTYLTFLGLTRALNKQDLENLGEILGNLLVIGPIARLALSYIAKLIST